MTDEVLHEFLLESRENLNQLDRELVSLEADPHNRTMLGSVFRTIHTVKGTSGFFQFKQLESVAHAGETLLSKLRDGSLVLEAVRTSALLAMVDAIRALLLRVEASGDEGEECYAELVEAISLACSDDTCHEAAAILARKAASLSPLSTSVKVEPRALQGQPSAGDRAPPSPVQPASPARAPEAAQRSEERAPPVDPRIRVDVRLLDKLMNLVGELVLARNQLLQYANTSADLGLASSAQRLNLITTELQEGVMKTRMQSIDNVWSKFPRVVRDLCVSCGKQVRLEMEGRSTELDKTIIELISDPLTHLVRNAIDHGIEMPEARAAAGKNPVGLIKLSAFHEGGRVNIEIVDDGGGIDPDRIKAKAVERGILTPESARVMQPHDAFALVFVPGFSTAAAVTNISGRGVGMDVVKSNIERLGGSVDIDSRVGSGTTIKIRIPLTLAIIPALVVGTRGERFAIPQVNLVELVRIEAEQAGTAIERIHGVPVFRLRGNLLVLAELGGVLEVACEDSIARDIKIVVLQADERQFGLLVDEIYDTEEIVVKPLGRELKGLNVYAGATIMGDGRVALILDVSGLAERAGVVGAGRRGVAEPSPSDRVHTTTVKEPLLLFRSGAASHMALPLRSVARLEEFARSRVERIGRDHFVQYRGEILPLLYLSDVFDEQRTSGDTLQVVVHAHEGKRVGFVVDVIEDVAEEEFVPARSGGRRAVVGSAVIRGRITELLDADALRSMAGEP